MQPIELRLNKASQNSQTFYTIDKVWAGVGNVTFGQRKFMTYLDATRWAKTEWPKVPLLRNP
jgi:hypothetical protein